MLGPGDAVREYGRIVALGAYLTDVIASLAAMTRRARLDIDLELPAPIELETVAGAWAQILTNLIENAVDHAYPDGQGGRLHCRLTSHADQLTLTVADYGVGMPEAIRTRIFEPFFTTRRNQGGSGLGLHLVYNLVTQSLGGTIVCSRSPGRGTTLTVTAPLAGPGSSRILRVPQH